MGSVMKIEKMIAIAMNMTDEDREKEMAELIAAYPPGKVTAKISREEELADIYDEEWIPDKELMDDWESLNG